MPILAYVSKENNKKIFTYFHCSGESVPARVIQASGEIEVQLRLFLISALFVGRWSLQVLAD
jgi:hypothetical protein